MKRPKRFKMTKKERGQALVEFALSVFVLAMLLLGVVDFGMALYTYIVVIDATDEAAAYASLMPYEPDIDCTNPSCRLDNDDDIEQRVYDTVGGNAIVDATNFYSFSVTPDFEGRNACAHVTVVTGYRHTFMHPLVFGAGLDLHYEAVKRIVPQGAMGICTPP
jgi:hypothetical protein